MAQFSGKSFGLTLRHKGRVAEIVCALEGGSRKPARFGHLRKLAGRWGHRTLPAVCLGNTP
jgi:hypothetical protein